jgi:hypothetical protein
LRPPARRAAAILEASQLPPQLQRDESRVPKPTVEFAKVCAGSALPRKPRERQRRGSSRRSPGCYSAGVHASKPRTRGEKLAAMALEIPRYRCHQCYHRWLRLFHVAIPFKVQKVHRRGRFEKAVSDQQSDEWLGGHRRVLEAERRSPIADRCFTRRRRPARGIP